MTHFIPCFGGPLHGEIAENLGQQIAASEEGSDEEFVYQRAFFFTMPLGSGAFRSAYAYIHGERPSASAVMAAVDAARKMVH